MNRPDGTYRYGYVVPTADDPLRGRRPHRADLIVTENGYVVKDRYGPAGIYDQRKLVTAKRLQEERA